MSEAETPGDNMTRDEPRRHIRRSLLPWRGDEERTECGRECSEMAAVVDRDRAISDYRGLGQTRFYMLYCVTCAQTAGRWPNFDEAPMARLRRERGDGWPRGHSQGDSQVDRELRALAMLAVAHPDEFSALVEGLRATVSLRRTKGSRR